MIFTLLRRHIWESHTPGKNLCRWGSTKFNHILVIKYVWSNIKKNHYKKILHPPSKKIWPPQKRVLRKPLLRPKIYDFMPSLNSWLTPKMKFYERYLFFMRCFILCLHQASRKKMLPFGIFHYRTRGWANFWQFSKFRKTWNLGIFYNVNTKMSA